MFTRDKKNTKLLIILLAIITLLKGLLWLFIVPIFQAPDEPQHYSYVQYLAEKKSLPQLKDLDFTPSERLKRQLEILETDQIAHNAHIQHSYYRQASNTNPYELLQTAETLDPTPGEYNYTNNYGPLYYLLNLPFYYLFEPNLVMQVFSMRFFSLLLSCCTVVFAFLSALKMPQVGKRTAFLIALFISFLPQFSFISSSINNDNLLILFFTFAFYLMISWWKTELTLKRILVLALVSALALTTKTQGVLLIILSLLYVCKSLLGQGQQYKSQRKTTKLSSKIIIFALTIAGLATSSILFFRELLQRTLLQWHTVEQYFNEHSFLWLAKTITLTRLFRTYKSFVGRFGWLDTLMPQWAYIGFFVILVAGALGLILFFYHKHKNRRIYLFLLISVILTDLMYTALFAKNAVLDNYYNFPTQGRYYFIVILPISILLFQGLKSLKFPGSIWLRYLSVYFVILINLVSILAIIPIRYYE